jgi:hypothetical protein
VVGMEGCGGGGGEGFKGSQQIVMLQHNCTLSVHCTMYIKG